MSKLSRSSHINQPLPRAAGAAVPCGLLLCNGNSTCCDRMTVMHCQVCLVQTAKLPLPQWFLLLQVCLTKVLLKNSIHSQKHVHSMQSLSFSLHLPRSASSTDIQARNGCQIYNLSKNAEGPGMHYNIQIRMCRPSFAKPRQAVS